MIERDLKMNHGGENEGFRAMLWPDGNAGSDRQLWGSSVSALRRGYTMRRRRCNKATPLHETTLPCNRPV